MKKIYFVVVTLFLIFQFSYAQTFEIRVVNKTGGVIGVEMRETSGTGTPKTSDQVTDIVFGIKWLQSLGTSLNLNSISSTSYNIVKSGNRQSKGSYYYQAFGAVPSGFSFPSNWDKGIWVEIMSIANNLQGNPGTGTFQICEASFDDDIVPPVTLGPNIGVNLIDYTASITGQADNVPTPVELSSFTASINQSAVNLKWQTKTEVSNYGFEVERKIGNGKLGVGNWEKIGFVNGQGNSNSPKDYSLTDKNPSGGSKFIYRLKQIDNDGKFEYSDEVEIELIPNEFNLFQNYPNPFNPATNIKFALPKAAKVTLLVYNLLGEKVATLLNEDKEAGFYDVQFDASSFSSGVYIFRLTTDDFVQTKKMTLIK